MEKLFNEIIIELDSNISLTDTQRDAVKSKIRGAVNDVLYNTIEGDHHVSNIKMVFFSE